MTWQISLLVPLCFFNRIISLILPLAHYGYKRNEICLMTDHAENPWNLPTKDNIVRRLCEKSLLPLHFIQMAEMRALVADAQPEDSFFFYCK